MDKNIQQLIQELLNHLPDSNHYEDCWLWCWGELSDKFQNDVKSVRKKAHQFLGIKREFL